VGWLARVISFLLPTPVPQNQSIFNRFFSFCAASGRRPLLLGVRCGATSRQVYWHQAGFRRASRWVYRGGEGSKNGLQTSAPPVRPFLGSVFGREKHPFSPIWVQKHQKPSKTIKNHKKTLKTCGFERCRVRGHDRCLLLCPPRESGCVPSENP